MPLRCSYCWLFATERTFSCSECPEEIFCCQGCITGHQKNEHQIFFPQGNSNSYRPSMVRQIGTSKYETLIDHDELWEERKKLQRFSEKHSQVKLGAR